MNARITASELTRGQAFALEPGTDRRYTAGSRYFNDNTGALVAIGYWDKKMGEAEIILPQTEVYIG
tara:strand:- start:114 stop:311 length:198 start_codon:yes stop_codon:yes gene_type:complete